MGCVLWVPYYGLRVRYVSRVSALRMDFGVLLRHSEAFSAPVTFSGIPFPFFLNPSSLNPSSLNPSSLNPFSLNPFSLNPFSLNPFSLNPFSLNPFSLTPFSLTPL